MRSPSRKRNTTKERELTERIKELEERLAESVPKAKFDSVQSSLQSEISDLKTRLSAAELQASQLKFTPPSLTGQLDEDGFEESVGDSLVADINHSESFADGFEPENREESENEDAEDSDATESPESRV